MYERRGTDAEVFLEDGGEIGLVVEAHGISHLRDIDASLLEELLGLFQTQVAAAFALGLLVDRLLLRD